MIYRTYVPTPPLAEFVESIWLYDGYAPPHAMERVLPSGTIEIVINLRGEPLRIYDLGASGQRECFQGPLVSGTYSEQFAIDTAQQAAIMGIHFKPGGGYPILGPVVGELGESHVPLENLGDGRAAGELWDRLLEAETPDARFLILEQYLLRQLAARSLRPHPAVTLALAEFQRIPQTTTITEVTARTGLSARRFNELFRREVGLTPKIFGRIRRFQEALHLVESHPTARVDWADLALSCGYYDQAHFNRDFRAFSGITPTTYLNLRGEHVNHVPIPERGQILPIPPRADSLESGSG